MSDLYCISQHENDRGGKCWQGFSLLTSGKTHATINMLVFKMPEDAVILATNANPMNARPATESL